ncbi:type II secretion system F family protein [Vibrio splendidus]|uniref:type II secretion system F family protein n=1 Tax=Vibrio splendidus TaxID=29497 RepID=UPI002236BB16|nr:type II secretion system F family protein [Vibrio splendidus]MCW4446353.1 type II secretion system F family protein [Vibrio splendidus]
MRFHFQAYDRHGAKQNGMIEASSLEEAKNQLKQKQLTVVKLVQALSKSNAKTSGPIKPLTLKELEIMTSELALLLESGVRIDKGLDILAKGSANNLGQVMAQLASSVRKGDSLSASMATIKGFDHVYISLVKMAEESGNLPLVFGQLAKELKFRCELKAKIIQSLTYPAVILFVCVACILFVFNFIVPRMSGLFEQATELPIYTELLLNLSQWMQNYQLHLFVTISGVIIYALHLASTGQLKVITTRVFSKTPGLRNSVLLVNRIQVSSSMAMLLTSGVKLDQALKLACDGITWPELRNTLSAARSKVGGGESLTLALSNTELYSDLSLSLIEVGEESGELARVFDEVAHRSRTDFESWTSKLTSILEPLMILVMGGIVGGVVVVMLLSITSLNDVAI